MKNSGLAMRLGAQSHAGLYQSQDDRQILKPISPVGSPTLESTPRRPGFLTLKCGKLIRSPEPVIKERVDTLLRKDENATTVPRKEENT